MFKALAFAEAIVTAFSWVSTWQQMEFNHLLVVATEFLVREHIEKPRYLKQNSSEQSFWNRLHLPTRNWIQSELFQHSQAESSLQTIHDVGAIYHCAAILTFLFQKPEEAGQHEEVHVLPVNYSGVERWQGSINVYNSSEHGQLPSDLPWPNCGHSSTHMQILLNKTNIQEDTSKPTSTSTFGLQISGQCVIWHSTSKGRQNPLAILSSCLFQNAISKLVKNQLRVNFSHNRVGPSPPSNNQQVNSWSVHFLALSQPKSLQ